jgi:hypothetical protein
MEDVLAVWGPGTRQVLVLELIPCSFAMRRRLWNRRTLAAGKMSFIVFTADKRAPRTFVWTGHSPAGHFPEADFRGNVVGVLLKKCRLARDSEPRPDYVRIAAASPFSLSIFGHSFRLPVRLIGNSFGDVPLTRRSIL